MTKIQRIQSVTATALALCLLLGMLLIASPVQAQTTRPLLTEAFSGGPLPEGWTTLDADGDGYTWEYASPETGQTWIGSPSIKDGNGTVKADNWLIAPPVDIPSGDDVLSAALTFSARVAVYFLNEPYRVYVSTSPITSVANADNADLLLSETIWADSDPAVRSVDLSAYRGQTIYIAFRHYTTTANWYLYLRDVSVSVQMPSYHTVTLQPADQALSIVPQPGSHSPVIDDGSYRFSIDVHDGYVRGDHDANVVVKANDTLLQPQDGVYTLDHLMADQVVTAQMQYLTGDVDGSRVVDATDALMSFQYASGARSLNPTQISAADIDKNGFNNNDALILFQYISGLREFLDVNKNLKYIWSDAYADAGGFASAAAVSDSDCYQNGSYLTDYSLFQKSGDSKLFFYNSAGQARVVNAADGYAVTLPSRKMQADYSLSALRSRYTTDDGGSILNISKETGNPYSDNAYGWNIYLTEWLNLHVANDGFLSANDLSRTRAVQTSTSMLSGYTVITYDIVINNASGLERPYYNIGVVRKNNVYKQFYLFLMKSTSQQNAAFDTLIRSFKEVPAFGAARNEQDAYSCEVPSYWSQETADYYEQFRRQETVDFGVFTASMPGDASSGFNRVQQKLTTELSRLQGNQGMNHQFELMPTYTHCGFGGPDNVFPSRLANQFAGGDGKNGKPVLHFTYQFTTSNNTNLGGYTPIYDILRGGYDEQFRQLARDIKAYGKPMFFRLNNEMNTDWTSYCGMVSLLDPDIFILSWQRLYDIFRSEGVDNCIWVFNPIAKTTPFCSWGEDLCYMPGAKYVQAVGLTSYETGNGSSLRSFEDMYTELYEKNTPYYSNLPWIISEFGCGAGGERLYSYNTGGYLSTTPRRNQSQQAAWVTDMFGELTARKSYCRNIKGAVWFGVNDYCSIAGKDYIVNYFALDSTLTQTLQAFRKGFAAANW